MTKELSDSTIKAYQGRIISLEGSLLAEKGIDYDFDIENWKDIIAHLTFSIKYTNPETCKGYLSALMYATKGKPAYDKYHEYFQRIKQQCIDRAKQQLLPEKRRINYLNKEQLIEAYNLTYANYLETKEDYYDHLILALYIIQPPVRADYCGMEIIQEEISIDDKKNYCVLSSVNQKNDYFVFNEYKTKKTYGKVLIPIEKDLSDLLRLHYHARKEKYVLPDFWTQNTLSQKVRSILLKITTRECSIGLIRHAWVYDLYKTNPTLLQKEELARKMLHSVAIQELYRTSEDLHMLNLEE